MADVVSGSLISAPGDPVRDLYAFAGWFSDEARTVPWVFASDIVSANMTLYAGWTHLGTAISTPQELADFVLNAGGLPQTGMFYLANDIDMSSISTLVGSTMVFSGMFDGQGYTIRNVVYTAGATKTGFLCKEVASGGIIQNVVFRDCQVTGIGESNAFIAAFAQAGTSFLNLEFHNVGMVSTGSYTGLLFADVPNVAADGVSTQITIRNITVMNDADHRIESGSYVGGLMGACRKAIIIDVENLYFDGIVKDSTQTAAAVFGRMNAAAVTVNVRNAVIKGQITAAAKNGGVLVGVTVTGGTVTADHVFIDALTLTSGTNKIGTLVGNLVSGSTATGTDIYYVSENVIYQYGLTSPYTPFTPVDA
ncbi:MAG TPA: InlB B-repeat-containing protein, partial [Candidatus Izemoplasmatales bacterium]|nr:InlB B-repeat-containing protein [Candidatus Izemoplasmatales bacterium]